jgi:hypothetical protein
MAQDIKSQSALEQDATTAMPMTDVEQGEHKKHVRTGDKSNEQIVIPKNRLVIVFIGLMLTVFLAALDQTIVCMASPLSFGDDMNGLYFCYSNCASYHCTGFKRSRKLRLGWDELSSCFRRFYTSLWTS